MHKILLHTHPSTQIVLANWACTGIVASTAGFKINPPTISPKRPSASATLPRRNNTPPENMPWIASIPFHSLSTEETQYVLNPLPMAHGHQQAVPLPLSPATPPLETLLGGGRAWTAKDHKTCRAPQPAVLHSLGTFAESSFHTVNLGLNWQKAPGGPRCV